MAPHPTASTASKNTGRRQPREIMLYPSKQGINIPSRTQSISTPGTSGCSSTSRTGSHSKNGVSSSPSARASSRRSTTCPKPNGTAAGNNKANGHKASITKPPRACGINQRYRNRFQWSIAPKRSSNAAVTAPSPPPSRFKTKSTLDGTRTGRKFCSDSIANDKPPAVNVALPTARRTSRGIRPVAQVRSRARHSKKPSGAYPTRLVTRSKPVQ